GSRIARSGAIGGLTRASTGRDRAGRTSARGFRFTTCRVLFGHIADRPRASRREGQEQREGRSSSMPRRHGPFLHSTETKLAFLIPSILQLLFILLRNRVTHIGSSR